MVIYSFLLYQQIKWLLYFLMKFRSFGFDIENYISNDLSETLFRLFQERGFIRTALEKISNLTNSLIEIYLEMIDTATIFIPLSFLAGVYGMNFEYFLFWIYFKKKRWV